MQRSGSDADGPVVESGKGYRRYLLTLLLAVLALSFVDRSAMGLLLEDIKVDLQLTDTQLGLMSGIAFAFFYAIVGLPIARWADRGNRVTIITLTTALWSIAVALCGVVGGFTQLLLVRVGVAVGEAGCMPVAHSLIADYFSRSQRARAVAVYMLGWPISVIVGYFFAGWLNELYGWRTTFICLGLPGIAVAALARLTLREPRGNQRSKSRLIQPRSNALSCQAGEEARRESVKQACAALWSNRTFRQLLFAQSLSAFFGYGILQWQPAFFLRSYDLDTATLGAWLAVIWGVGGLVGTYLGGALASRYAERNERLQLRASAATYVLFGSLSACVYVSKDAMTSFALLGIAAVGISAITGPLFAIIQTLVPDRLRAFSIAVIYLFANLIGMGLGPWATGILSDVFRVAAGAESLRYALLSLCPGYVWCAWHFWCASTRIVGDMEARGSARLDGTRGQAKAS